MPLLTTAPSPSCWDLAKTFLRTNLGVVKAEEWSDCDMMVLREKRDREVEILQSSSETRRWWLIALINKLGVCCVVYVNVGYIYIYIYIYIYRYHWGIWIEWKKRGWRRRKDGLVGVWHLGNMEWDPLWTILMMTSIYCHRDDCLLPFNLLSYICWHILYITHTVNSLHTCNFSCPSF